MSTGPSASRRLAALACAVATFTVVACRPSSYVDAQIDWEDGQHTQIHQSPAQFQTRGDGIIRHYVSAEDQGVKVTFGLRLNLDAGTFDLAEMQRIEAMGLLVMDARGGVLAESGTVKVEAIGGSGDRLRGRIDQAHVPALPPRFPKPGTLRWMEFSGRPTQNY